MIESVSLWYNILAHISISTMKRLINSDLILCDVNNFKICEMCVKSKMIKKHFHIIERNTNLIDLVRSYLCEFNGMLNR